MSKGAQIACGATAVALLLAWYGSTHLKGDAVFEYYQTLDEFLRAGSTHRNARVHGYVALQSIQRDVERKQVRFALQTQAPHAGGSASSVLPVVYESLETPDLFKDGAEVVVEGRLNDSREERVFVATNVLAKCPSKFQAETTSSTAF